MISVRFLGHLRGNPLTLFLDFPVPAKSSRERKIDFLRRIAQFLFCRGAPPSSFSFFATSTRTNCAAGAERRERKSARASGSVGSLESSSIAALSSSAPSTTPVLISRRVVSLKNLINAFATALGFSPPTTIAVCPERCSETSGKPASFIAMLRMLFLTTWYSPPNSRIALRIFAASTTVTCVKSVRKR